MRTAKIVAGFLLILSASLVIGATCVTLVQHLPFLWGWPLAGVVASSGALVVASIIEKSREE